MKQDPKHPIIVALVLLCVLRVPVLIVMASVAGLPLPEARPPVLLLFGVTLAMGCGLLLRQVTALRRAEERLGISVVSPF